MILHKKKKKTANLFTIFYFMNMISWPRETSPDSVCGLHRCPWRPLQPTCMEVFTRACEASTGSPSTNLSAWHIIINISIHLWGTWLPNRRDEIRVMFNNLWTQSVLIKLSWRSNRNIIKVRIKQEEWLKVISRSQWIIPQGSDGGECLWNIWDKYLIWLCR